MFFRLDVQNVCQYIWATLSVHKIVPVDNKLVEVALKDDLHPPKHGTKESPS